MTDESKPTPPTPEEIQANEQAAIQAQKEKIEKIAKALDIPRIKEDVSALREEIQSVSQNLTNLVNAIKEAQQGQQTNNQQQMQSGDDISPEQKMLLLKDGISGLADLVKAWKGTSIPQGMQQQNNFQEMIMQSFAKMIQAKVDETIFSTYGTQIPHDQINLVRQIQNQAANLPQKPGFQK